MCLQTFFSLHFKLLCCVLHIVYSASIVTIVCFSGDLGMGMQCGMERHMQLHLYLEQVNVDTHYTKIHLFFVQTHYHHHHTSQSPILPNGP